MSSGFGMELQMWTRVLLVLAAVCPPAEAMMMYDPQLCYILDGFLGLYGLIITGMFIKEKFFRTKVKDENIYSDLHGQDTAGYAPLMRGHPEDGRSRNRKGNDDTYTDLNPRTEGTYKELPMKRERQKPGEQVYQGLSKANRDTYDSLQMQPLPSR